MKTKTLLCAGAFALALMSSAFSAHARLSDTFNYAYNRWQAQNVNGWTYFNAGPDKTQAMYRFNGRYPVAVIIWALPGQYMTEPLIWQLLNQNGNGTGWVEYNRQTSGGRDFRSGDGQMLGKVFWYQGGHVLRVAYTSWINARNLWVNPAPKVSKSKKSKPKFRPSQPSNPQRPPIEEFDV